jgi:hypothetical protein
MNKNAAFHGFANYRRVRAWQASLAAAAMLLACLAGSAARRGRSARTARSTLAIGSRASPGVPCA